MSDDALAGLDFPFDFRPTPTMIAAGQPDEPQFRRGAEAGIRHVINLRPVEEQPGQDEAALIAALGMRYHHLPVADASDLSRDKVEALDLLLAEIGDEPTLFHCASSNRVGALMALREAWLRGADAEAAVAVGRAYGLTRMEGLVRALLDA